MASSGRINYTVGFTVDKTGLNQLRASLQEIQRSPTTNLVNVNSDNALAELKKIKSTAAEVEKALSKSFNANLGVTNLQTLNQELKNIGLDKIYADFSKLGAVGTNAFRNMTAQILSTKLQIKQTNQYVQDLADMIGSSIRWGLTSSIWNNMSNAVSQAYSFAKKLDTSLNDIRIVTGKSADEMERYAIQANKAAASLGQSTTAYTNASLIYYQQGLDDAEVEARTEVTLKAANVTGQSADAVSEQLTSIWNGYKVSAEEAELYIDKVAAVAATTASDLEELSTGMSKVASAANLMGVDVDQLNAQLATIISVTRQAPESVGTALKTIYARMGDIESGVDDETTLGEYTKEMSNLGFDVLDANGKLKDMGGVIEEIGEKWKTLSREQQIALSQAMAGTRQYNNLLSLFDNWDMYTDALETSVSAAGTLQEQQDIYMDSMKAHLQELSTAGEKLYNSLFDPSQLNPLIDILTTLVNLTRDFISGIGGMGSALTNLGAIATSVFKTQISSVLSSAITNAQTDKFNAAQVKAKQAFVVNLSNLNPEDERLKSLVEYEDKVLNYSQILSTEDANRANALMEQTNELYKQQDLIAQQKEDVEAIYEQIIGNKIDLSSLTKEDAHRYIVNLSQKESENKTTLDNNKKSRAELRRLEYSYNHDNDPEVKNQAKEKVQQMAQELANTFSETQIQSSQFDEDRKGSLSLEFENLRTELKNASTGTSDFTNLSKQLSVVYGELNEALGENQTRIQKAKKELGGMVQAEKDVTEGIENYKEAQDRSLDSLKIKEMTTHWVNLANAAMRVASIIQGITSIKNIISNDDLTVWEKFSQIMSAISMISFNFAPVITSIIGLIKKEKDLITAKKAEALEEEKIKLQTEAANLQRDYATLKEKQEAQAIDRTTLALNKQTLAIKKNALERKLSAIPDGDTTPLESPSAYQQNPFDAIKSSTSILSALQNEGEQTIPLGFGASSNQEAATRYRVQLSQINQELREIESQEGILDSLESQLQALADNDDTIAALNEQIANLTNGEGATDQDAISSLLEKFNVDNIKKQLTQIKDSFKSTLSSIGKFFTTTAGTVVAVVGALVAGIAISIAMSESIAHAALNNAKDEAEKAAKQVTALKNAYQQANQDLIDLKQSLSDQNEAKNTIDDLTIGTEEWSNAIKEANQNVVSLLSDYAELAQYVTTDENGQLQISQEGQKQVISAQQKKTDELSALEQMAEANKLQADANLKVAEAYDESKTNQGFDWVDAANIAVAVIGITVAAAMTGGVAAIGAVAGLAAGVGIDFVKNEWEDSADLQEDDFQRVLEAYQKDNTLFAQSNEKFAEATGIQSEKLIESLKENSEDIIQAAETLEANTLAAKTIAENATNTWLSSQDYSSFENSDYQDEIVTILTKATNQDSSAQKNILKAIQKRKDDEVREEFAEKFGYTWKEKDTYTDASGNEVEIELETIEVMLAQALAYEEEGNSDKIQELVDALASIGTTSQELTGTSILTKAAAEESDFSGLTQSEQAKVQAAFDSGELNDAISSLNLETLGTDLDTYLETLETGVTNYAAQIAKVENDVKDNTSDAVYSLFKKVNSSDFTGTFASQLGTSFVEVFQASGEEAAKLYGNLLSEMTDSAIQDFVAELEAGGYSLSSAYKTLRKEAKELVDSGKSIVDKLLEDSELTETDKEVLDKLESKQKYLGDIWDRNSRQYIEALQVVIGLEDQIAASSEYAAIAWAEAEDAYAKYQENATSEKVQDLTTRAKAIAPSNTERYQKTLEDLLFSRFGYEASIIYSQYQDGVLDNPEEDLIQEQNQPEMDEDGRILYFNGQEVSGNEAKAIIDDIVEEASSIIKTEYDNIKIQLDQAQLQEDYDDLNNFINALENATKAQYEVDISVNTENLDKIIALKNDALQLQKALVGINEDFTIDADNVSDILGYFPELAEQAKVLSDGTVQLDNEVTSNFLKAQQIKTEGNREEIKQQIEDRMMQVKAELDATTAEYESFLALSEDEINYQDWMAKHKKGLGLEVTTQSTKNAETEAEASSASTEVILENWDLAAKAALVYGDVVQAVIKGDYEGAAALAAGIPDLQAKIKYEVEIEEPTEVDSSLTQEDIENKEKDAREAIKTYYENHIQQLNDEYASYLIAWSELNKELSDAANESLADSDAIDLLDDVLDIYHDINILLDDMAKKIERVNTAQKHLLGADWLGAQKQGIDLLNEEIELRKKKLTIQQSEAVALQGHLLADGVTFNEDGSVVNYAEIMTKQMQKVIDAQKSGNEDAADAAEKNYKAFKENFERYEEVRDEIEDMEDKITDALYQQIEKQVAAFTYTLEINLDLAEAERKWKEFINSLIVPTKNYLSQVQIQSDYLTSDRSTAQTAVTSYNDIVKAGIDAQALVEGVAAAGVESAYAIWDERLNDGEGGYRFDQEAWKTDIDEALSNAQDAITQILTDIETAGKNYLNLLNEAISAQKESLEIYDEMTDMLDSGLRLVELLTGEENYSDRAKFIQEKQDVAQQKTEAASSRRSFAESQLLAAKVNYQQARDELEQAIANGDTSVVAALEAQLNTAQEAYDSIEEEYISATKDFYTTIEEQIEVAQEKYTNAINEAIAKMDSYFFGDNSISYINDEWDLINKNADKYLDTVNSTYEVSKLESKYSSAISNSNDLSAQKKLRSVMEDELDMLQEKDKLSQYDIDRANKKYDLTLKQIALEEAQNNKSSMRLRRDAAGNYSYEYVADEDAVAKTQQELLDAQNDLYNFDKERYQETLDEALKMYQEYQKKIKEAASINDPEERAAYEKMITEQYQELILGTTADNETARLNLTQSSFDSLKGQYDYNAENFEAMTKDMFDDFSQLTVEDMPNCLGSLVTGWDSSLQTMVDTLRTDFVEQSTIALDTVLEKGAELDAEITSIKDAFAGLGSTAEEVANAILQDVTSVDDALMEFKEDTLDPVIDKAQEEIGDAWSLYRTGIKETTSILEGLTTALVDSYTSADNLYKKLINIASQSPIDVSINYRTTGDPTTASGGYGVSGGSGSGDTFSATDEEEYEYTDDLIWETEAVPYAKVGSSGALMESIIPPLLEAAGLQTQYNTIKTSRDQYFFLRRHFPNWKNVGTLAKTESGGKPISIVKEERTGVVGYIPESYIKRQKGISSFDTGGYTGEWGSEGKMAMLHQKEIVLNSTDTENLLSAVEIVRSFNDSLQNLKFSMLQNLYSENLSDILNNTASTDTLEQNVHITAEFPGVTKSSEIEQALNNLVNVAAQRAFSTIR